MVFCQTKTAKYEQAGLQVLFNWKNGLFFKNKYGYSCSNKTTGSDVS